MSKDFIKEYIKDFQAATARAPDLDDWKAWWGWFESPDGIFAMQKSDKRQAMLDSFLAGRTSLRAK